MHKTLESLKTKRELYQYLSGIANQTEWIEISKPLSVSEREMLLDGCRHVYETLQLADVEVIPCAWVMFHAAPNGELPNDFHQLSSRQRWTFMNVIRSTQDNRVGSAIHELHDFMHNYNRDIEQEPSLVELKAMKMMLEEILKIRTHFESPR